MSKKINYTKQDFYKDVTTEAKNLKKYATKRQLAFLDFKSLDPQHANYCVYGQITGSCKSTEASKLISKCCKRYYNNSSHHETRNVVEIGFKAVKQMVNGKTIKGVKTMKDFQAKREWLDYLSSIETYILMPKAKNKNLIDYLQGKTNKLVL